MRRIGVIVLLLAVTAPAAATPRVPRIWLVSSAPVTVTGRGFQSEERVKVVVKDSGERWIKAVVANASGSFTARFRVTIYVRCDSVVGVTAVGSMGSRAAWKAVEEECPPIDPIR